MATGRDVQDINVKIATPNADTDNGNNTTIDMVQMASTVDQMTKCTSSSKIRKKYSNISYNGSVVAMQQAAEHSKIKKNTKYSKNAGSKSSKLDNLREDCNTDEKLKSSETSMNCSENKANEKPSKRACRSRKPKHYLDYETDF